MNYKKLNSLLVGRNTKSKKLSNNTYAIRHDNGVITIRLHKTDIIIFLPNGRITLNSGGWKTVTTKARINEFSPFSISQAKGIWHISKRGQWNEDKSEFKHFPSVLFKDGMSFYKGRFIGAEKSDNKINQLRKEIQDYCKLVVSSLPLPAPSGGDCWYCSMMTQTGQSLGDATKNIEHLKSHIEEKYIVPSLVNNALKEANAAEAYYGVAFGNYNMDFCKTRIGQFVKRYLYRQFGLVR